MIGLGTNMNSGFFLSRQYEHVFINTTHWLELKRICFCKNIECYYSKAFFFFFKNYSFWITDSLYIIPWFTHIDQ